MGTQGRVIATTVIWAAFTLIMIFADVDTNNLINLAILAGAAMISTVAVWDGMNSHHSSSKQQNSFKGNEQYEKAKRSDNRRLTRLIKSMDEDDISSLEAILASRRDQLDEDEQIELNRLLADQERSRH
jgi:hypothetical protein